MFKRENLVDRVITADKSWTLYSNKYGETYHSVSGAVEEAFEKFIRPCAIPRLAKTGSELRILDVCFGLGYNALAAWHTVKSVNPAVKLEIVSLEIDEKLLNSLDGLPLPVTLEGYQPLRKALVDEGCYREENRVVSLVAGDATNTIDKLLGEFHAVFWDPFSPPKNPELWTLKMFKKVRKLMSPEAILATYSANQRVRKGMLEAGFKIGLGPAIGRKKGGTLASIAATLPPISEKDFEKIKKVESIKNNLI